MRWRGAQALLGGVVWAASVVQVAQYTYKAFSNTYVPFPIGGGGSIASIGPGDKSGEKGAPGVPAVPKGPAGAFLSPPNQLVQPVVQAVQEGTGTRALAGWLKVVAWANSPAARRQGWSTPKLVTWLTAQGWFGRFYDLTGWTPSGISHAGRP